jgi:hypothetical protein
LAHYAERALRELPPILERIRAWLEVEGIGFRDG